MNNEFIICHLGKSNVVILGCCEKMICAECMSGLLNRHNCPHCQRAINIRSSQRESIPINAIY